VQEHTKEKSIHQASFTHSPLIHPSSVHHLSLAAPHGVALLWGKVQSRPQLVTIMM